MKKIKNILLSSVVLAVLPVLTLSAFSAEAGCPVNDLENEVGPVKAYYTYPFNQWLGSWFVLEEQEQNFRENCNFDQVLEEHYNKFIVRANDGNITKYNGASDIFYFTIFHGEAYVFLVQACGDDPKVHDGTTWSFPGGKNGKTLPIWTALREGSEETLLFGQPSNQEFEIVLKNIKLFHMVNPRFAGEPNVLTIVPVTSLLNWDVIEPNYQLAREGYAADMKDVRRPKPNHEKANGRWVSMKDIINKCSGGKPDAHVTLELGTYDVQTGVVKNEQYFMRRNGVFGYINEEVAEYIKEKIINRISVNPVSSKQGSEAKEEE